AARGDYCAAYRRNHASCHHRSARRKCGLPPGPQEGVGRGKGRNSEGIMIIVLKPEASESEVDHIIDRLRDLGLKSQISTGQERTIIGVIGDDRILHNQPLTALPGVESVLPILA